MTGAASCSTCSTGRVRSGDLNNNYYICNSCQAGQVALAGQAALAGDNECSDNRSPKKLYIGCSKVQPGAATEYSPQEANDCMLPCV